MPTASIPKKALSVRMLQITRVLIKALETPPCKTHNQWEHCDGDKQRKITFYLGTIHIIS